MTALRQSQNLVVERLCPKLDRAHIVATQQREALAVQRVGARRKPDSAHQAILFQVGRGTQVAFLKVHRKVRERTPVKCKLGWPRYFVFAGEHVR